jgi:FkbM family methyltransferase
MLGVDDYFAAGIDFHPGMTVLDVGANIGLFALELLRRLGGDARIYAFEPAPATFADLERNVRELFPAAPVRLERCALGATPGSGTLYFNPSFPALSSLYEEPIFDGKSMIDGMLRPPPPDYPASPLRRLVPKAVRARVIELVGRLARSRVEPVACRIATVSEVIRQHELDQIDLLKIDVEGAEVDVLRGIDEDDWLKIRALAIEVHDVDAQLARTRATLESAGYPDIRVEQNWPFEGTTMYNVFASRLIA